jgi:hypothetical protein
VVQALLVAAKKQGCYKCIVDCSEANVAFYERQGFKRKEVQCVAYFPANSPPPPPITVGTGPSSSATNTSTFVTSLNLHVGDASGGGGVGPAMEAAMATADVPPPTSPTRSVQFQALASEEKDVGGGLVVRQLHGARFWVFWRQNRATRMRLDPTHTCWLEAMNVGDQIAHLSECRVSYFSLPFVLPNTTRRDSDYTAGFTALLGQLTEVGMLDEGFFQKRLQALQASKRHLM